MKVAKIRLTGVSPYSPGRYHMTPQLEKEQALDYEKRTWREKAYYNQNGEVFMPSKCIKNMLSATAKFLAIQIPGKGKSTYTKNFEAGIICLEDMYIGCNIKDAECNILHLPSDGQRGGTKRVLKYFPLFQKWAGETSVIIADETITRDVFEKHLSEAGKLIGLGTFRPRNNGYYGRFQSEVISWSDYE